MTPHFKIISENINKDYNEEHCFGEGKYCPDSTVKGDVPNGLAFNGRDVLHEDLRVLCLYQRYYNDTATRHVWWDYVKEAHQ